MRPESAELYTNEPGTHMPANAVFKGSSNPLQYQSFDPELPPVYVQQGTPVNFEIAHPSEAKLQELNSRLDKDCYCCYKYFVLVVLVLDVFGIFGQLMLLSSGLSHGHKLLMVYQTLTTVWDIVQLYKIFQAMNLKDLQYAKQAIKMMKIYMIIIVFSALVQFGQGSGPVYDTNQEGVAMSPIFMFIFAVAIAEGLFYLLIYFGARKVTEVLTQVHELRSSSRTYNQLSTSTSSPTRV